VLSAGIPRVIEWCAECGITVWVAASNGCDVGTVAMPGLVGIVIGNEGAGVSREMDAIAAGRIGIRLRPEAESLNAAAAAAILLYEATR